MRIGALLLLGALLCGSVSWATRNEEPVGNYGLSGEPGRLVRYAPGHAEKVLKVLESANEHNDRLQQMDQQLFGENPSQ